MKYLRTFLLITCTWFSTSVFADFTLPDFQHYTLKNGLNIYLMEQHEVPLIDVRLTFKAGAIYDQQQYGLATMTARAIQFGAGNLTKTQIEDQVSFVGAELDSSAGTEFSSLRLSMAKKDQQAMLAILAKIASAASFNQEEFHKYQQRYLSQLQQMRESPRNIIRSAFERLYYGQHPYGNPVSGDTNSVKGISLDNVKSFYNSYYQPDNAALIVVGDFDSKAMAAQLQLLFGDWQGKTSRKAIDGKVKPHQQANVWLIDKSDAIETTFMIGGKGIARNHPDYVALSVINTILGARFTSWLNDELRVNSGLTYGARSRFNDHSQAGSFAISTFTKTATTFEAVDLALKTYDRLWDKGIDEATLASAKAYVKGQFPPDYETGAALAGLLSDMWAFDFNADFINQFEANVDALNVEKANQLAKAWFPKDNLQFVLVGKAEDIKAKAADYGKVTLTDINELSF